jgi:hypothetical protein
MPIFNFEGEVMESSWLVKPLIPLGHLCVILAQSGMGKSFVGEYLALCCAWNRPFLDMETLSGPVLIIDQDTPADVLASRLKRMGAYFGGQPPHEVYVESMAGHNIKDIPKLVNTYEPRLVIIDSLHSLCGKLNPNHTTDMNIWSWVKSECLTSDRTIVINHHISEKQTINLEQLMDHTLHLSGMGSSAIKQLCDTEYILTSTTKDNKIDQIYLRPIAKRQAVGEKPVQMYLREPDNVNGNGPIFLEFDGYYEEGASDCESDIMLLMQQTGQEYTIAQAREAIGCKWNENKIRDGFKKLEKKGEVVMRRGGSNLFKYRLPDVKKQLPEKEEKGIDNSGE